MAPGAPVTHGTVAQKIKPSGGASWARRLGSLFPGRLARAAAALVAADIILAAGFPSRAAWAYVVAAAAFLCGGIIHHGRSS